MIFLGSVACMGKIAASVLRRGISMVMKYATPLTPLYFKRTQNTIHALRRLEKYTYD